MMTTNKETGQTQKPSAPRELTVENLTQNSVTFRWAANDASEKVTQYEIYRSGIRVGVTGGTTFSNAGLMATTRYEYQVKAVNAVGTSDASPSIAVTTLGESPQGDTWTSGKAYGVGEIVTYKEKYTLPSSTHSNPFSDARYHCCFMAKNQLVSTQRVHKLTYEYSK